MNDQGKDGQSSAPIILVSPDMRPSVMGVAQSLVQAGLLERFITTLAFNGHSNGSGSGRIRSKLHRMAKTRTVPSYLNVPIETFPLGEIMRLAAARAGLSDITGSHVWEWSEIGFDRKVANKWAGKAPCIYGCENASVETFEKQKSAGGYTILWQVIAHHKTMNRLVREEYETFPDTITPYIRHLFEITDRVNERKDRQFANADLIVANSVFARQTFIDAGFSPEKVIGIPTGCPPLEVSSAKKDVKSPIVFLCAGNQSIRKGITYLLEAWRNLNPSGAELWLVGKMELPERLLKGLPDSVVVRPPVSRMELKQLFERASFLVLPTLCEGLAHIILEAMSSGLGIITTENSGCGNLVEDSVNGWKVPIRSADAIADKIAWVIANPQSIEEMSDNSLKKAAAWQESDFAITHIQSIKKFLNQNGLAGD